jgi:hypothetical protein
MEATPGRRSGRRVIFFPINNTALSLQNLDLKKLNDEKKAALAAQFAAEATLRRVQAAQKDEDLPPIEAILAPLEAELKIARQEVSQSFGSC